MKNILFYVLILSGILISCNRNKSILTEGEWIGTYSFPGDTTKIQDNYTFMPNGDIFENRYTLADFKYRIDGNKFYYLAKDTISSTYSIISATPDEVILESDFKIKAYQGDSSTLKFVYTKTKSSPQKPYDSVLFNLGKMYNIGKADILGDGTIFYNFMAHNYKNGLLPDNPYQVEPKIKGAIDRGVGSLPKTDKKQILSSVTDRAYNHYVWETLDYVMEVENVFDETWDNKPCLKVKIWITEKT